MISQAYKFKTSGNPVSCNRYGNGHINITYLLIDDNSQKYILQRINKNVFKDPESLMNNIVLVTDHLKQKVENNREVLNIIKTKDDKPWFKDEAGEYWRMYEFVKDSISLEQANEETLRESGIAFGKFQQRLADFPANSLVETIPRFHDTPNRYKNFHKVLNSDIRGRAKNAKKEIEFYLSREEYAHTLVDLQAAGELKQRVTHNDTKLNNVLFDRATRKALCVVDLDTVMPGLSVNDYGDSIRFGATTALEDEPDLSKVSFSVPLFKAYTEGYLSACGKSLTPKEIECLRDGAKMMTLECGLRFLGDYLAGDIYFQTEREHHNLDRTRTQMKLVADMEENWELMQEIIMSQAKG